MEFLKDPSLVLYSLSNKPLLSVLSYLIQQQTITSMLLTFNFSCHSQLWISLITPLTLKTLYLTYLTESLPTSCLLILLKPSFSSLVYHNNSLNANNANIHLPNNVIFSHVHSACNLGIIFDKEYVICTTYHGCFHIQLSQYS